MPEILKKRSTWAAFAIALLIAAYWVNRPLPSEEATAEISDTAATAEGEPLPGAPVPGSPAGGSTAAADGASSSFMAPSGPLRRDSANQFQAAYRRCVPDATKSYATLGALLVDLRAAAAFPPQKQWENHQIRLPNGEERRIMLLPREGASPGQPWDLRFFGVDAENLPVPMPLPENVRGIEDLARLMAMGTPIGHEVGETQMVGPGNDEELMTESRDGEIVDFQWRRAAGSLMCSTEMCRCITAGDAESAVAPGDDALPAEGAGDGDSPDEPIEPAPFPPDYGSPGSEPGVETPVDGIDGGLDEEGGGE